MKPWKPSILISLLFITIVIACQAQEVQFTPTDTIRFYHIVTLNDGTVLKGKILHQEKKTIEFQDEMLGNVTFRSKDVSSMEKIDPQDYYLITLMNETKLQGKIILRKEQELDIETSSLGRVKINISKIKYIKRITPGNMKDGKYWFTTRTDAHYLITPSAIGLRSGEAYYQNTMGLFNSFDVGITSNFSCMGGIFIPMAAFISPRISYKLFNGVHAGAGILLVDITGSPYAGAAYGHITFGNRNGHLSISGGYGVLEGIKRFYYLNKIERIELGLLSISGYKRISPKYALVTENWFTPTEGIGIFTGAFRLMGEKNTWDFGIGSVSINRNLAGKNFTLGPITFMSYMRNL